jgi:hypothetical protein
MIGAMAHHRPTDEQRARDVLAAEEFGVPAVDPGLHIDSPHDVLSAEEYALPAPDPRLHRPRPHDILAAEEFELPDRDPALHHGPVALPGDPTGIAEPHDVLAAEEFALPAGRHPLADEPAAPGARPGFGAAAVAGGALALLVAVLARKRVT